METTTFSNIRENEKIDKSRYYAEAIIAQYNWQDIGIEEFKFSERNELIKRLQERNCVEIYERLQQFGIEESQIPTILLNIAIKLPYHNVYKIEFPFVQVLVLSLCSYKSLHYKQA